jgi:hypothetical protein
MIETGVSVPVRTGQSHWARDYGGDLEDEIALTRQKGCANRVPLFVPFEIVYTEWTVAKRPNKGDWAPFTGGRKGGILWYLEKGESS